MVEGCGVRLSRQTGELAAGELARKEEQRRLGFTEAIVRTSARAVKAQRL